MLSKWLQEDGKTKKPAYGSRGKHNYTEMPPWAPEKLEEYRLQGWSKAVCIAKAGLWYMQVRQWVDVHPEMAKVWARFPKPGWKEGKKRCL